MIYMTKKQFEDELEEYYDCNDVPNSNSYYLILDYSNNYYKTFEDIKKSYYNNYDESSNDEYYDCDFEAVRFKQLEFDKSEEEQGFKIIDERLSEYDEMNYLFDIIIMD